MTDDLVAKLRDEDSYYRLQEKHWCIDAEELERQRLAAADLIKQLEREKAVVSDLWEQQKEIALGYLADCNALSAENERLRRDHAALAKQLDIAKRKLKSVTKLWHIDRAALGGKQ